MAASLASSTCAAIHVISIASVEGELAPSALLTQTANDVPEAIKDKRRGDCVTIYGPSINQDTAGKERRKASMAMRCVLGKVSQILKTVRVVHHKRPGEL